MASGYEKHECGVDPNFGWKQPVNKDGSHMSPMKVRIIDTALLVFAFGLGSLTLVAKASLLREGIKWLISGM